MAESWERIETREREERDECRWVFENLRCSLRGKVSQNEFLRAKLGSFVLFYFFFFSFHIFFSIL